MKIFRITAVAGYAITGVLIFGLGIFYTTASRIMPYHQQALEIAWEAMDVGPRWMVLNYMRSTGAGFIATAISVLFLLTFPFRKRELWSYFAIFLIGMIESVILLVCTASVGANTAANPPLTGVAVIPVVLLVCFISSLIDYRLVLGRHFFLKKEGKL